MKNYSAFKSIFLSLVLICVMTGSNGAEKGIDKERSEKQDGLILKRIEFPQLKGKDPTAEDWKSFREVFELQQDNMNTLTTALQAEIRARKAAETEIYQNMAAVKRERKIQFKEAITTDNLVRGFLAVACVGGVRYAFQTYGSTGSYWYTSFDGTIGFFATAYVAYSIFYLLQRLFIVADSASAGRK